jgi:hypothetical protein
MPTGEYVPLPEGFDPADLIPLDPKRLENWTPQTIADVDLVEDDDDDD